MADNSYKVQINVKVGDHLININGETVDEVVEYLHQLAEKSGEVHAAMTILDGRPATEIVQKEKQWGARSQSGRSYPKSNGASTQAQTVPTAPDAVTLLKDQLGATTVETIPNTTESPSTVGSSTHFCTHGERVFREGTGAKGKWSGWFCPETDRAKQCTPEWSK